MVLGPRIMIENVATRDLVPIVEPFAWLYVVS